MIDTYRTENSVIGACLLERGVYTQVRHLLKPDEFQDYRNEGIWQTMDRMYLKSQPIDFLTVCEKIGPDKDITKHMAECCQGVASTVNVLLVFVQSSLPRVSLHQTPQIWPAPSGIPST